MRSSRAVLELGDISRTFGDLGLGLEDAVLEHIPECPSDTSGLCGDDVRLHLQSLSR